MSLIAAGASLLGGFLSSSSANKAAEAQEAIGREQIALQREIYDDTVQRVEPFYDSGQNALQALMFELGLGERPTFGGVAPEITTIAGAPTNAAPFRARQDDEGGADYNMARQRYESQNPAVGADRYTVNGQVFDTREQAETYANANLTGGYEYQGYQATPGYQFALDQGLDAINARAGASGGLDSGATRTALMEYGQELQNQYYGQYLDRLTGQAGDGLNAAALQGTAGTNYATGASNALANIGNAQAAGAVAQGNAWSNTLGDLGGMWQYQRQQGAFPNAPAWL